MRDFEKTELLISPRKESDMKFRSDTQLWPLPRIAALRTTNTPDVPAKSTEFRNASLNRILRTSLRLRSSLFFLLSFARNRDIATDRSVAGDDRRELKMV